MSAVTSIRDYIDLLITQIGPQEPVSSLFSIVGETFPHILKICKDTLWYCVSFQGLRDNFYQPYIGEIDPRGTSQLFSDNSFGSWDFFGAKQLFLWSNFRFFVNGLVNSIFFTLPGSIGTLLILRRIILEGVPAGLVATIGGVLGNCTLMVAVTFGNRILVLSPAFLDFSFFFGLLIPSYVVLRGLCYSDYRLIPAQDIRALIPIGFMNFLLGISNQSTLFKHLRNLTIDAFPTRFLGISGNSSGIFYILGFSIGSSLFAFAAFYGSVFLINWWLTRSTITRSRLMKITENFSIVFLTGLSISTLSYYGTDFLLTKGLGFLPTDKSFSETVLAPNSLFKDPHNLTGVHALYPSNEFSLDPGPFDRPLDKALRRSILLKQPGFKYRTFEELNYQGEKHWLHRGFRHGSAKPIKTVTLPAEKNKLSEGRALLRSLDKAIGWVEESQTQTPAEFTFTNLAKEDIDFETGPQKNNSIFETNIYPKPGASNEANGFLEQKFKRLFFGHIGLLPGRLPNPTGPFDSQEMAHKRLAFTNPVYKALLSFDIDLFLKRQPSTQSLSAEDEHNIFLKRQLLERYINTQRDYFDEQTQDEVYTSVSGRLLPPLKDPIFLKSLANQTYKHQFKGTLEIVRQMFAVSLDCPEPSSVAGGGLWDKLRPNGIGQTAFKDDKGIVIPRPLNPRVLKFDQPLYTSTKDKTPGFNSFRHEELYNPFDKSLSWASIASLPHAKGYGSEGSVLQSSKQQKSLRPTDKPYNFIQHKQKPFLEDLSISPFYVGWDNERHQLVLTRRFLDRENALVFNPQQSANKEPLIKVDPQPKVHFDHQSISFATWPLVQSDLNDKLTANWRLPSRSFEQMISLEEEARMGLDEPSDKNKGLRGSYNNFVELWNKNVLRDLPQEIPSFKLSRWPYNITTPSVQADLDSFDQIEKSLFTGVKRGGFMWPGSHINFKN